MLKHIGSISWPENSKVSLETRREIIEAFHLRSVESCEVVNTGKPVGGGPLR